MTKKEYTDRLYEFHITLYNGTWEEFVAKMKKDELDIFLGEDAIHRIIGPDGFHFAVPELSEAIMFVKRKKGEKGLNLQTFVHELNHVCLAIFDSRGIPVNSDYSEPYCYYYDFLFGEFTNKK